MKRVLILCGLGFLIMSLLFTGCGGQKIRVGTGTAPERLLLAQLIILILSENGFEVIDMTPTGSTEVTHQALESGMIDIYPEYTGNYLEADTNNPNSPIVWLKPAPADNKWAIAIPERLSEAAGIKTMSNFAAYVNNPDNKIKLICSHEFTTKSLALPLFEEKYQFKLTSDQLVVIPDTNTLYMGIEAADASNDINATLAYTTDGHLESLNLIILEDDKNTQPVFHPAPIMRKEIYTKYEDELNRILTPLFASLDNETLKELNSQIGLVGKEVTSEIARKYLLKNCYFKYSELEVVQDAMNEMMDNNNLNSVASHPEATSDMAAFPDEMHPLYSDSMRWPCMTWRTTRGTYSCDSSGLVTQETTGWE